MKFSLVALFCLLSISSYAQINTDNIYKTWVVSKVTYKDGSPLADDNPLKYAYIKYGFGYPDKFSPSITFSEKGTERTFEIKKGLLQLKSSEGFVINTQKIEELDDKLIVLQAGYGGFDDPSSLLFTYIPENVYQENIKLNYSNIQSIYGHDTTYVECPKIYASYKGDSFVSYMYKGISDHINMHNRTEHLFATFIVSKNGVADSLELIQGIDPEFDKRFIKVFNQAKYDWKPAVLNGKYVNVLMKVDLRYSTTETMMPAYFAGQKGLEAYNNKNYKVAEYYYGKALETEPSDKEYLYRRGMCKLLLGNKAGACEDWNKAKSLGSSGTIDAVLDKFCN
jgi:hypothetical protein